MDASLVSAGFGALSSAITTSYGNKAASITAAGQNMVRAINNTTTLAANQRNATLTRMQRWAQDVRNSRVYESVGKHQEALAVNFNRARDARTRANFAQNIREAEEQGRMQASAAASGVTGSIVDVIDQTSRLKSGIQDRARVEAERQISYDYKKTEFDQRWALLDSLDHSLIFDNPELMDFGQTQPKTQSVASAAFAGFGVKGVQATANFFNFKAPDVFQTSFQNTNLSISEQ